MAVNEEQAYCPNSSSWYDLCTSMEEMHNYIRLLADDHACACRITLRTMTSSSSFNVEPPAGAARLTHPFANTKGLLVLIPDDKIDVEEESRLYDELCEVSTFWDV